MRTTSVSLHNNDHQHLSTWLDGCKHKIMSAGDYLVSQLLMNWNICVSIYIWLGAQANPVDNTGKLVNKLWKWRLVIAYDEL